MIELIGLNKSFLGNPVLQDVNLFIQEGEIFGIIGKSGAGKSTLLRCMNLLECPEHGQVFPYRQPATAFSKEFSRPGARFSDQVCIAQEADGLTGFHQGDRFAEFHQPVGLDQRGQQARALAWELHHFGHPIASHT